jgi:hypothetical protein
MVLAEERQGDGWAVGLGRIAARTGGLPAGVLPQGELTGFAAARHLARAGPRSVEAGDGGRNSPGTPGV